MYAHGKDRIVKNVVITITQEKRATFTNQLGPIVPLTTRYSAPASCTDIITYSSPNLFIGLAYNSAAPPCVPNNSSPSGFEIYSPGICPLGFTNACTYSNTGLLQSWLTGPYTALLCCPSSYSCTWNPSTTGTDYGGCYSLATTLTNVWSITPDWPGLYPASYPTQDLSTMSYKNPVQVRNNGVLVAWQSTDTGILHLLSSIGGIPSFAISTSVESMSSTSSASPSYSSSVATLTTNKHRGSTSTSRPASRSSSSTQFLLVASNTKTSGPGNSSVIHKSNISSAAKIGLGVGIPVIVLSVIIGMFLLWRHRKRRYNPDWGRPPLPDVPQFAGAGLPHRPQTAETGFYGGKSARANPYFTAQEADSTPLHELPNSSVRAALSVYELPSPPMLTIPRTTRFHELNSYEGSLRSEIM